MDPPFVPYDESEYPLDLTDSPLYTTPSLYPFQTSLPYHVSGGYGWQGGLGARYQALDPRQLANAFQSPNCSWQNGGPYALTSMAATIPRV